MIGKFSFHVMNTRVHKSVAQISDNNIEKPSYVGILKTILQLEHVDTLRNHKCPSNMPNKYFEVPTSTLEYAVLSIIDI